MCPCVIRICRRRLPASRPPTGPMSRQDSFSQDIEVGRGLHRHVTVERCLLRAAARFFLPRTPYRNDIPKQALHHIGIPKPLLSTINVLLVLPFDQSRHRHRSGKIRQENSLDTSPRNLPHESSAGKPSSKSNIE